MFVIRHEVTQPLKRALEGLHIRQENQAEVVGLMPVEGAAVAEENFLIFEQVKHELFVALDVELFGINFGEQVERAIGLFSGNAVDFVEHTIR